MSAPHRESTYVLSVASCEIADFLLLDPEPMLMQLALHPSHHPFQSHSMFSFDGITEPPIVCICL